MEVVTSTGTLSGEVVDGLKVFRGVPFAAPPIGELRFKAPQPLAPWQGVRPARSSRRRRCSPGQLAAGPVSEDCLYLNVWRPLADGPHPCSSGSLAAAG